jgi:glycosyltransferase involved in cell wall biosynthesis
VIAAIVPACNEEDNIGACLRSLIAASRCPRLQGEATLRVVALDTCTDATEPIARSSGAAVIVRTSRNVGMARRAGARLALAAGAHWLSFTDADSMVAPNWLSAQLEQSTDAVCGTVAVLDWGSYGARMRSHFDATYTDADSHRHIHGANLGVRAEAYRRAGGFRPLESSEIGALVQALKDSGASIAWSAALRVLTSARRSYRAAGGFGAPLPRIVDQGSWHGTAAAAG